MNTIVCDADRVQQKTLAIYCLTGRKIKRTQWYCSKCGKIVSPRDCACRCGALFL